MKRREFISLLGGTAAAWPVAARAQQAGKLPTIGYFGASAAVSESPWTRAARSLSSIAGRRDAPDRAAEIAAEFVRLKVDIIVTTATPPTIAAKRATSVIPIVFAVAGDPVGTGLVASLARPGGNVTGLSLQATDLAGKRIELLREVVPGLRRLAIMGNVGNSQVVLEMGEVQAAARTLGLDVITSEIRRAEDIAPAFEAFKGRADALFVVLDPVISSNRLPINTFALRARLPTMRGVRDLVEAAGLMSYGPNFPDLFRRSAGLGPQQDWRVRRTATSSIT
jgi:putative tryptophan/tyrosine transport system substrate-binding protein